MDLCFTLCNLPKSDNCIIHSQRMFGLLIFNYSYTEGDKGTHTLNIFWVSFCDIYEIS